MPKNTTAQGDLAEWEIATALARTGKVVLRPLSAGLRYDLAVDNLDGTVMRIQCKSGSLKAGFIRFRPCNSDARRPNGVPYHGQIEAFGVFCPQNGRSYLIPIDRLPNRSMVHLRLAAVRNGQRKRLHHAADFEIRQPPWPDVAASSAGGTA